MAAGLFLVLALTALPARASGAAPEGRGWTAYRLEAGERGLRALADRAFLEGRRVGGGYELSRGLGPEAAKAGRASGRRTVTVTGEPGPDGRFRPRVVKAASELTETLPGGAGRTRVWTAVLDLDGEGVRVSYDGWVTRPDGTTAPDLESDPRDADGWAQAVEGMVEAWDSPGAAKRRFFDPWF